MAAPRGCVVMGQSQPHLDKGCVSKRSVVSHAKLLENSVAFLEMLSIFPLKRYVNMRI